MQNEKKHRYEVIYDDILMKIERGVYQENTIIPKEVELAEQYGVSRPTVRQAIQNLVDEGYLERKKRKGTIVNPKKINQEFTHVIESFTSEMGRKGLETETQVLLFKEDIATKEVADHLKIAVGDKVYKLVRLRYVKADPVVLVTTYLPGHLLPGFRQHDFTKVSLYATLNLLDLPVTTIKRKLEVIKADETVSDLLQIDKNDPIFYFHSVGMTQGGVPVEYSISKYRGDINSFVFEIVTSQSTIP